MRKTFLTTMVALVLVGTVSLSAFAFGNGRGQGQGPKPARAPRIFESLNLTPDQQQKLLVIRQDFQKETQPLRFEMQKKQLELRQLWSAETLNQSAIEAKEKEIVGFKVQMVNKARAMQDKMKSVLTAEQRKKLEESGFDRNPGTGRQWFGGGGRMFDCFGA